MTDLARLRADTMALAQGMLAEHTARLRWDAATLANHRAEALRALVKTAVERSPWHRERLAGLPLDSLEPDDLVVVPSMTKADVMASFDRIVVDPRVTLGAVEDLLAEGAGACLFDEYTAAATGGSTGARGVSLFDRVGLATWWISGFRGLLALRAADPELRDRQVVMAWVSAAHASHMSALLARTFNDASFRQVSVPVTLPLDEIVARLNQTQPDWILVYPSVWPALVREAEAGRLRIAPRRVMGGGEPLLPEIRAMLAATWGVPVDNRWGATEVGALTDSCALGFGHLAEDYAIVEPVDADGRPVPAGERSAKILVTNLFNHALPLIRYEITDEVVVVPGPCPCGSPTVRIADVQGRLDDLFHYPSGQVHPHVFRSILGRRPQILEYRVRQTERGAEVSIRCSDPIDLPALAQELRADLAGAGLPDPEVRVAVVEALDRLPHTGKLRRFLPLAVQS